MAGRADLMSSAVRRSLEAYASRLRARFGERLRDVRLFGSYARGEAHEDSDVDVLVLVDGLADLELGVAFGEAAYVVLETGMPLSPIAMSTERFRELLRRERLLAKDIEREGISL